MSSELRGALKKDQSNVKYTRRFFIVIPDIKMHRGHLLSEVGNIYSCSYTSLRSHGTAQVERLNTLLLILSELQQCLCNVAFVERKRKAHEHAYEVI